MLDWTVENKDRVKHYIVTKITDEIQVHITRTRTAGGRPLNIIKEFPANITYQECIKKIENLCDLDDEIYTMLHNHQHDNT